MLKKYIVGLLSLFMILFASCSDDEYTSAALLNNAQVYFANTTPSKFECSMSDDVQVINVPLYRIKTDEDLTVNVVSTGVDGDTISVPASVTFAKGDTIAYIPVSYKAKLMGYNNVKNLSLSIADEAYKTVYGYGSIDFSILVAQTWKSLGNALYTDDIISTLYGVPNITYEVELQECEQVKGFYRLVYPYDKKFTYNEKGNWDESKTYYLEIHAEDPNKVYFFMQPTGVTYGDGAISIGSAAGYFIEKNKPESAAKYYGTLKDGILTFPQGSLTASLADYNNGEMLSGFDTGSFRIVFPGVTLTDYSISASYSGVFTDVAKKAYAVTTFEFGADVETAKACVVEDSADPEAVADAILAGDIEAQDIKAGENRVAIGDLQGDLRVVAVTIADNKVQDFATCTFEYYSDANPWVSLGNGVFTDDFIYPLSHGNDTTFAVEILENSATPGLYRVVNPYASSAYPHSASYDKNKNYYLEIDATDPDGVLINEQNTYVDFGYGESYVVSYGAYQYATKGTSLDDLKAAGYLGTLKDDVITLPALTRTANDGTERFYQGYAFMGPDGYYVGSHGSFKVVLPSSKAVNSVAKKSGVRSTASKRATINSYKVNHKYVDRNYLRLKAFKALD